MALKTIAHALFSWTERGQSRIAMHGQTVEIDDSVIAAYERFGVFAPDIDADPTIELADTEEPADDIAPSTEGDEDSSVTQPSAPVTVAPKRPKSIALESVWQDYARERGLDPDGMTKDEIIAAFPAEETKNHG